MHIQRRTRQWIAERSLSWAYLNLYGVGPEKRTMMAQFQQKCIPETGLWLARFFYQALFGDFTFVVNFDPALFSHRLRNFFGHGICCFRCIGFYRLTTITDC